MNFCVALIARNESQTLPRLVASLGGFIEKGGQIFLLDTGSTDGTPEVAEALGCHVVRVGDAFAKTLTQKESEFINSELSTSKTSGITNPGDRIFDYAGARNYIATYASRKAVVPYVFMPDCDEFVTHFDVDLINQTLEQHKPVSLGYNFVYGRDEDDRPITEFMHSKFYRTYSTQWVGLIHEVLDTNQILYTNAIQLEHKQNEQTNRNHYLVSLAYEFVHTESPDDRNTHYLARELYYRGYYKEALLIFAIHTNMNGWDAERNQSFYYMGKCNEYLGSDPTMDYIEGIRQYPHRRECYIGMAEYYDRQKNYRAMLVWALMAMVVDNDRFYGNYAPYYQEYPYVLAYRAAWYAGDKEKATTIFNSASELFPNSKDIINDKQFFI